MRIPPMPPRDDRPAGDRCEVTLRDTFAAAALTGLLAARKFKAFDDAIVAEPYAEAAYCIADAMLRERDNTSAETNNDLGSVTSEQYAEGDEKRGDSPTKRCATQPRNGALSGCETVPDPDSRVWETQAVPNSRTENEPVAWIAVFDGDDADGEFVWPNEGLAREWASTRPGVQVAPLYLHPQPMLTTQERSKEG